MPLPITNLPPELLSEITRSVVSKKDLRQLRSVNSLFETLATPEAFNSITVRNNKRSTDGFWNLLHTPRLVSYIQSISFVEAYTLANKEVEKRLKAAYSILRQVPNLKTLEFYFNPCVKYFDYDDYTDFMCYSHQWDIVFALGSNQNTLSALQSLKIDGLICCEEEHMELFYKSPIKWPVASLRQLSLTFPRGKSQDQLEWFWKHVVVRCILQPAVNLESLVITGQCHKGQRGEARWVSVSQALLTTFPRLATLSLRHMIVWDPEDGQGDGVPLEFILHHRKTLKKLELHKCAISVSSTFGPPYSGRRYWADIYKRLANRLTGLVELKVELEDEDEDEKIPYVFLDYYRYCIFLNKGDLERTAPEATLEKDALALEEFRAVVKYQGMGDDLPVSFSTVTPDWMANAMEMEDPVSTRHFPVI